MSASRTTIAEPGFGRASAQPPLAFSGNQEVPGFEADDDGSDWDELRLVGLIERDGFIPIDTLDADWE